MLGYRCEFRRRNVWWPIGVPRLTEAAAVRYAIELAGGGLVVRVIDCMADRVVFERDPRGARAA